MADINTPAYPYQNAHGGTWGNQNVNHSSFTAASVASGTNIHMVKLQNGNKVMNARCIHGALGASSTLELQLKGIVSGTLTALSAANQSATADVFTMSIAPVSLTEDCDVIVTTGGASISGQIDVVTEYTTGGII